MNSSPHRPVDAAPFAARRAWSTPDDYEIWWEDPRDVFEVEARFEPGRVPDPALLALEYWQQSWPKVRVPKDAQVGAGREGWLAIDDWSNGRWQPADCDAKTTGDAVRFTFHPLNLHEFPDETDFPATFRRTIKLRLHFPPNSSHALQSVSAYTDSEWREAELAIEWKSRDGAATDWSGHLEIYNGALLAVKPLTGHLILEGEAGWTSTVEGPGTAGVLARVRYAHNEDHNSYDRTVVSVVAPTATGWAGLPGFSFAVDDALAGEGLYVRDLGVLVTPANLRKDLLAFEAEWARTHGKTLHQRIQELPEQTWERAWAGMPAKRRRMYFVLGCEGSRQKFGVDPNGDIFLEENFVRRVPGKDTPRLGWPGRVLRHSFGIPAVEPVDRFLLEGYLPIIRTMWLDGDLCYQQEAFATWLPGDTPAARAAGDDTVVAMVRIRITNLGSEASTGRLLLTSTVDGEVPAHIVEREGLVYARSLTQERSPAGDAEWLSYLFDTNGAGALRSDGDGLIYEIPLQSKGAHSVYARIPFIGLFRAHELTRLRHLVHAEERNRVAAFWRQRISTGSQVETPNEMLNDFYRTHLMHMLVINDREPGADRNVARCGGFHYGSFPDEGCMVISDLDRRGYTVEARRCLDLYVQYQGTAPLPGNYSSAEGVFYGSGGYEVAGYNRNQGWVLWCLAEHYRYTRDLAWLQRVAPALIKGCDWITRERGATMVLDEQGSRPITYGFLPTGSLEDVTDYWTWLSTNAYAYLGLRDAAAVLAEIRHPEAARLHRDAEAYRSDLRTGFFAAAARSPAVPLRDGTWVPHFPPRQERRGRDFGWLREVLEGAAHLIYCGIIAPDEAAAQWIIDDYEDNLFLSDTHSALSCGYGYPAPDFERQWFGWGGFSMQPNLLIFPLIYLWRDEPKHYLRAYFNPFASAFYPDTMMLTEHALPTLADWMGDHFKTSDEANSTYWLRLMFLAELGDELFVGQAIPREWLEDGKRLRVERALTHFGETSVEIVSQVATGHIVVRLDAPRRNPPRRIRLRVRHPRCEQIRSVWVNGLPHADFDAAKEVIYLAGGTDRFDVRVSY